MMRAFWMLMLASLPALWTPAFAAPIDATPRTVLMTAFPPEWDALEGSVENRSEHQINGLTIVTGTMTGRPVLLVQSGVSMVNAAMNTQLVLDRFTVRRIVFSGIAGGVDPALAIGDVVIPEDWGQYLEVSFARQTPKGWVVPEPVDEVAPPNFGMMFPRGVRLGNADEAMRRHYVFRVDADLLALARTVSNGVVLRRCLEPEAGKAAPACLGHAPRVVVGGTGVSAGVFADNAEFRDYLFSAWRAKLLDMESSAVAQVAYANRVPVIIFRSLSDLAGGDAGENQMETFMALAAVNSADVVRAFVAALPD